MNAIAGIDILNICAWDNITFYIQVNMTQNVQRNSHRAAYEIWKLNITQLESIFYKKENFYIVRNMSFQMKRIEDVFLTTKNGYGFVESLQKVA